MRLTSKRSRGGAGAIAGIVGAMLMLATGGVMFIGGRIVAQAGQAQREQVLVVEAPPIPGAEKTMDAFETITLAPIDRRLIDVSLMTADAVLFQHGLHEAAEFLFQRHCFSILCSLVRRWRLRIHRPRNRLIFAVRGHRFVEQTHRQDQQAQPGQQPARQHVELNHRLHLSISAVRCRDQEIVSLREDQVASWQRKSGRHGRQVVGSGTFSQPTTLQTADHLISVIK